MNTYKPTEKAIKEVGDIVCPKPGYALRSGCSAYDDAIVVSVEPYVMVSVLADMRWGAQDAKNYLVRGKASDEMLARCMTRL